MFSGYANQVQLEATELAIRFCWENTNLSTPSEELHGYMKINGIQKQF